METISTGHGLLEGPVWDERLGLLVADAAVGGVWRLGSGTPTVVVPHRRGIGGLALHENGAVVIGGRNIALKWPAGEGRDETVVLLDNDPAADVIGYNDFTTDAAGRIYVGSLAFVAMHADRGGKAGRLHVIDLDGSVRSVADDVMLTNGLDFSPDGTRLYHSDTLRSTVYVYDVEPNGDVRNRRNFVTLDGAMPDGLAVDSGGNVWVAEPHSGTVRAYAPDGRPVSSVSIPVPMVTSLCFGGADLKDLYIVSGSEGLDTDHGAGVWRARVEVPGKRSPLARVALPR
ncbi:SMP-30/gluconolactonase/LRE family protein [Chelatococcus reniformis]|uniref:SMP-30/gluconolactonase/LRE family protein n=1 Tax=Chelatococcus reniformis TaxID=1494448 RepID=UPI00166CE38F|nr:SMP-30/gluconolactonase/LRE family protein [Chelatococcus reniformis]